MYIGRKLLLNMWVLSKRACRIKSHPGQDIRITYNIKMAVMILITKFKQLKIFKCGNGLFPQWAPLVQSWLFGGGCMVTQCLILWSCISLGHFVVESIAFFII